VTISKLTEWPQQGALSVEHGAIRGQHRAGREGRIPKKFLEAILLELKKNGILNSKKGKGGGYVLGKEPQNISIGDIIRTLDGSFSEIFFEGETKETNEIKIIMKELRDAMSNILDKTSLADVIERACKGQNVLNYMI